MPSYASVPLVTGSAVHKGVEVLAQQVLAGSEVKLAPALRATKEEYEKDVANRVLADTLTDAQEQVKEEQLALALGLVRIWYRIELPQLLAEYEIVQSEKSMEFVLSEALRIKFLSKADLLLKSRETGELYVYSLKTVKDWTKRSEASYSNDLQGLTETLGAMMFAKAHNALRTSRINWVRQQYKDGVISKDKALANIAGMEEPLIERIMGVRFCFLVKGPRWPIYGPDGEELGKWTDSPLLYGYRRQGPGDIEYAHSDKVYKPENKSGFGKLGKGWEKFPTYKGPESEAVGGVKGWIAKLATGEMQPELENPLTKMVIAPTPRFPYESELASTLVQITSEQETAELARREWEANPTPATLDKYFPQSRRSCQFPLPCSYLYACYKATANQNLLDPSSPYEERTPHHSIEEEAMEE